MANARFARLYKELCLAGVAARHARRSSGELGGHHALLVEEALARGESAEVAERSADRLIGTEAVILEQFVSRPELLAFSRRRPGWSFGVFPAIGLLMGVIGLFAALCLLPGLLHLVLPGARIAATALAIKFFTLWLGPVLLSFICAFLAYRYRIPLRWPLLTAVLVCMLGAMIHCQVVFDASRPTPTGSMGLGIGFPPPSDQIQRGLLTLFAALVPVIVAARLTARVRHSDRN